MFFYKIFLELRNILYINNIICFINIKLYYEIIKNVRLKWIYIMNLICYVFKGEEGRRGYDY